MTANWFDNSIQFPRLIAEIQMAGGFTGPVMLALMESMDLSFVEVADLIDRACMEWDRIAARTP